MAQPPEVFPRPGHAGDLHEWAKGQDGRAKELIESSLRIATEDLRALFVENIGAENMTEELLRELDFKIENVLTLASAHGIQASSPHLARVYDGEAFNA